MYLHHMTHNYILRTYLKVFHHRNNALDISYTSNAFVPLFNKITRYYLLIPEVAMTLTVQKVHDANLTNIKFFVCLLGKYVYQLIVQIFPMHYDNKKGHTYISKMELLDLFELSTYRCLLIHSS